MSGKLVFLLFLIDCGLALWARSPAPVQKGCAELGTCVVLHNGDIERVDFSDATCFLATRYVYGGSSVALSCIPKRK